MTEAVSKLGVRELFDAVLNRELASVAILDFRGVFGGCSILAVSVATTEGPTGLVDLDV